MTAVKIRHATGEYDIRFASLENGLGEWLESLGHRQRLIVTDRNVATHLLPRLNAALGEHPGYDTRTLLLDSGDENKDLSQLERIWNALAETGLRRDGLVIAFGGGVVGDMAGFAAASWMRGVDFFQIPTTLLAQVDASVGGKTAINHAAGKNLIGAFHQPRGVLIDTALLQTLPDREFRAGIAEMIKAALLSGNAALESLEADFPRLLVQDAAALERQVAAAIELKKQLVEADERERGQRAWLNLGHTFAHAIEHGVGYGQWLHGEAVAAGLVAACRVSEHFEGLPPGITARVIALLQRADLPCEMPVEVPLPKLMKLMGLDKKATKDGIRLILLAGPGRPVISTLAGEPDLVRLLSRQSG